MAPDARRHALEKKIDNSFQMRFHVIVREVRRRQPHAAVDVEADAAGRDHAALLDVHCGHPADWEAVAKMSIRHAKRVTRDAR